MKLQSSWASTLLSFVAVVTAVPMGSKPLAARDSNIPCTAGDMFNIDGSTQYFAGTNSYWIGFLTNDNDVNTVMSHVQSAGLKVLRVWGFNDVNTVPSDGTVYYQYLSNTGSTINTGANGLQRLDSVINAAEQYGIKLIINFVNNWSDYGGIAAYVNAFGGSATSWFTNAAAQSQYQSYISAVVSRYKSSNAIFAWELANEPRCNQCDPSVVYSWASSTSAFVKSLDSTHMVTLGDEGFNPSAGDGSYPYSTYEGVSFSKNLAIPTLDFGTYHMYPSSWGTNTSEWATGWIQAHGDACKAAGKPCLLEEYGYTSDHVAVEGPWQAKALATDGNSADMFWQMGDSISSGQTPNDGFTIYYGSDEWASLVSGHMQAIQASGR